MNTKIGPALLSPFLMERTRIPGSDFLAKAGKRRGRWMAATFVSPGWNQGSSLANPGLQDLFGIAEPKSPDVPFKELVMLTHSRMVCRFRCLVLLHFQFFVFRNGDSC